MNLMRFAKLRPIGRPAYHFATLGSRAGGRASLAQKLLPNVATLALAVALSLLGAEGMLRLWLDEVNFLQPELQAHPVLRHVIVPGSADHDRWGFRNAAVPEAAEVVAIGDSQTYGLHAPAHQAWPAWLERLSGRSVYNLSLGGYGPPDYQYLLDEYGLSLAPEVAIVGFYFGNDLPRAGDVAVGKREPSPALAEKDDPRPLGELRTWLSRHSVLYQAVKYEATGLANQLRYREATQLDDGSVALPTSHTALIPDMRFGAMDTSVPRNRRGLDATLATFLEVDATCRSRLIRCLFLLIPTKESVYALRARDETSAGEYARIARAAAAEEEVRREMTEFLTDRGLEVVDPLPALRRAAEHDVLYPANADGHPLAAGYRVIAEVLLERLVPPRTTPARATPARTAGR
jgi:hypothetical protein